MTVLGHAAAGATWQAMLVVVALALVVVVALAAAGRLELERPGDLVLPLAAVAIVSSLAPLADRWLSDWIGWAFPVGVAMLLAMLLAALTPLRLTLDGWLPYAALGLAVLGAVVLYQPLTIAWHPPAEMTPEAGDAQLTILAPEDGATLPPGEATVEVAIENGSIGPGGVPFEDLPADVDEAGMLEVTVAGQWVDVDLEQDCTLDDPCSRVSFPVDLPEGDEVRVRVQFLRGDGMPFSPATHDVVVVTVD